MWVIRGTIWQSYGAAPDSDLDCEMEVSGNNKATVDEAALSDDNTNKDEVDEDSISSNTDDMFDWLVLVKIQITWLMMNLS